MKCTVIVRHWISDRFSTSLSHESTLGFLRQAVYEMLLTWIKRVPRSMDKCRILCDALRCVGRNDLAEEISDKEYYYKEQRAEHLRGE